MGDFIYYITGFDVFVSDLVSSILYMLNYFFPLNFYDMPIKEVNSGSFTYIPVVPCFTMLFIILLACYLVHLVRRVFNR